MTDKQEQLLVQARLTLRRQLAAIAHLDQLAEIKASQSLTLQAQLIANVEAFKQRAEDSNTPDNHRIYNQIMTLQDEIEEICQKKVRLANSLHCQVAGTCEEMDLVLGPVDPVGEEEVVQECLREEALGWCVCEGEERREAAGQCMILCEGKECPYRWYHMRCVGLTPASIPETWYCQLCQNYQQQEEKIQ